jgi:hypothetical protein
MTSLTNDLKQAQDNVSASSAGGAPFLIAYGATFFLTALLSFVLPRPTAALIALFQGAVALPIAFWLERRMGSQRLSPDNPLKSLSAQMAMSQALALPALIVVYSLNPSAIPVVLAGVGGVHFLPYAWLHRTRIYAILAGAVAIGAFALQLVLRSEAFPFILLYIAAVYWVAAPLVYRHAAKLVKRASEQNAPQPSMTSTSLVV